MPALGESEPRRNEYLTDTEMEGGVAEASMTNADMRLDNVATMVKLDVANRRAKSDAPLADINLGTTTAENHTAEAIFPPQQIDSGKPFFELTLHDFPRKDSVRTFHFIAPAEGLVFESGKEYIYTLSVKNLIRVKPVDIPVWGWESVENTLQWSKFFFALQVSQAQDDSETRGTKAPAIKSYRMKTDGKPVFAQVSSEAYIGKHAAWEKSNADRESRGVSITSDTFYDRFGLFYYQYGKDESWQNIAASGTVSPTVSNFAVEKSAGWLTDKYWPGADHKLTFMAYAPYDNDYKSGSTKYIQLSSSIKGYPTLTYTVPAKVEDQRDLLVSAEPNTQDMEGDYNKVIGMKFYHVLSAINFKIGSTMAPGRISKIEVKGICNKGNYDFGTREWTGQSGTANYAITPNYVVADQRGVVFTGVDDAKNDLMLVMPQTVPSGAKIVVTIQDGANYSVSHEMELPIEGHEWLPGYTITYALSTSQENGDHILSDK